MITLDQGGATFGRLALHGPPRGLAHVLEHVWCERRVRPSAGADRGWRIVPDPSGHWIVHVRASALGGGPLRVGVVGPRSVYVDADVHDRLLTLGLRFRPGALAATVGVRGFELTDRSFALHELLGAEGRGLERELGALAARGPAHVEAQDGRGLPLLAERLTRRLLAFLAARVERLELEPRVRPALELARRGLATSAVARRLGVAPRTLRLLMREHVGLGTKRVVRIRRLYDALGRAQRLGGPWSAHAAAAGYCDQAHLIHDGRALLGETPGRFLARAR